MHLFVRNSNLASALVGNGYISCDLRLGVQVKCQILDFFENTVTPTFHYYMSYLSLLQGLSALLQDDLTTCIIITGPNAATPERGRLSSFQSYRSSRPETTKCSYLKRRPTQTC